MSCPERGPWGKSNWRGNTTGHIIADLIDAFQPGYGNAEGYGCVSLDFHNKTDENREPLRVIVWSDNNVDEPTHRISLAGAKN